MNLNVGRTDHCADVDYRCNPSIASSDNHLLLIST